MANFETSARTRHVDLERIDYRHSLEFSRAEQSILTRAQWHEFTELAAHNAVRMLTYHVYGRRKIETVEYPATWWDALKLRWFPRWALRRWPAQYAKVEIRAEALFPELDGLGKQHLMLAVCERIGDAR